jgi:hypothetical protein
MVVGALVGTGVAATDGTAVAVAGGGVVSKALLAVLESSSDSTLAGAAVETVTQETTIPSDSVAKTTRGLAFLPTRAGHGVTKNDVTPLLDAVRTSRFASGGSMVSFATLKDR